jgi:tetratricopeptide (TPR) repeat protein
VDAGGSRLSTESLTAERRKGVDMPQVKKTCFVISPIGEQGSERRQVADDFLELLIEPAFRGYGFEVIRADRIASSSAITSDIIRSVQTSELCVIDLTTHNPNVFYECGRRHETGRPFIQLIRKGEDLPFDVAGIRTITYDLSSPRSALLSVQELRAYLDRLEQEGYDPATGASLAGIADGVRRIESKLAQFETTANARAYSPGLTKEVLLKHPITAWNEAYDTGNLDLCAQLLPRIRRLIGEEPWLQGAANLAQMGEEIGECAVLEGLQHPELFRVQTVRNAISALDAYYFNRNIFAEACNVLASLAAPIQSCDAYTKADRAAVLNDIGIILHKKGDVAQSLSTFIKAIELAADGSLLANAITCLHDLGRDQEACGYADRMLTLPGLTATNVESAVNAYEWAARPADAAKAKERLAELQSGKEAAGASAAP